LFAKGVRIEHIFDTDREFRFFIEGIQKDPLVKELHNKVDHEEIKNEV